MSDQRTLYRIVGNSYPAEKEEALEDGWLELVEPNYEAAAIPILDSMAMAWMRRGLGTHSELMLNPELIEAADIIAHASVDAALGEPA